MYRGWLSFAGTEIANEARTRAYAAALLPSLKMPTRCSDRFGDLPALLDDEPYVRPDVDDAPWFDFDDPDSFGFCGMLPLSVSGATDSTREATVVQGNGVGGSIVGQRRATREVRVTGLLLGTTPAAVAYGKRWLEQALNGECDPCDPSVLCFLTAIPEPAESLGDYTSAEYPVSSIDGPSGYWDATSRVFAPKATTQSIRTPGAPRPLPCDEIFYEWTVLAPFGTILELQTLGEGGLTNTEQVVASGLEQTFSIGDRGASEKTSHSRLLVLTPGRTVTVGGLALRYRLPGDLDTCFKKYLRQIRQSVCVDGPRTIEEYAPSAGAMEKVEFSFVAESPWLYGSLEPVVSMQGAAVNATRPNATAYRMGKTLPVCAAPRVAPLVRDPDAIPVPPPPVSGFPIPVTKEPSWYSPYALYVPDQIVPLWGEAVPVLEISTGAAEARAVRVRFYPRPLDQQRPEDLDPCSACGSFIIDYIPAHSTFVLDGMEERAYIHQSGGRVSSGDHLLSGVGQDLFSWPVITCGTGYYAVVDVEAKSVAGLALSLAVRE